MDNCLSSHPSVRGLDLSHLLPTCPEHHCGFIAILGKANAGKSTLLNALLGQKLAAVSAKAHTTRYGIYGILCEKNHQMIFVDTPGLLSKKHTFLQECMKRSTQRQRFCADARLIVIDATRPFSREIERLLDDSCGVRAKMQEGAQEGMPHEGDLHERASHEINPQGHNEDGGADTDHGVQIPGASQEETHRPILIALNKIDQVPKDRLLPLAQFYSRWSPNIAMISAKNKKGLDFILSWAKGLIPQGPWLFSPQEATQIPQRMWAAELTREKLFSFLHHEVPYHLHVETDSWKERQEEVHIHQVIWVDQERYRKWILGHKGQRIRHVGILTRRELSHELGKNVHLFLSVKVDEKMWRQFEDMP